MGDSSFTSLTFTSRVPLAPLFFLRVFSCAMPASPLAIREIIELAEKASFMPCLFASAAISITFPSSRTMPILGAPFSSNMQVANRRPSCPARGKTDLAYSFEPVCPSSALASAWIPNETPPTMVAPALIKVTTTLIHSCLHEKIQEPF